MLLKCLNALEINKKKSPLLITNFHEKSLNKLTYHSKTSNTYKRRKMKHAIS